MKSKTCSDRIYAPLFAIILGATTFLTAHAQSSDQHPAAVATASVSNGVPPLKILLPKNGDVVGSQLAVVFQTPGHMSKLTMGAPVLGVHLHVMIDDTVLMPKAQQLIRLGGNRYLFLFDLPVKSGIHTISVFWADPKHETIAGSVDKITIRVTSDPTP